MDYIVHLKYKMKQKIRLDLKLSNTYRAFFRLQNLLE